MSRGSSGRIVIEIDPEIKKELYSALAKDGMNLKQWFLQNVDTFLSNQSQLSLSLVVDNDTKKGT